MQLTFRPEFACVGNVDVSALSHVTELDSGLMNGPNKSSMIEDDVSHVAFSHESLQSIQKQLAIIVPCMNEEQSILEGVLHGIPHDCLVILVSNSNADNFKAECTVLTDLCTVTKRVGIAVHQQDRGLARAFSKAGMPQIIDNQADPKSQTSAGRIHNGKGEAMMIGTALAKITGKEFVGFIDADNFVPGAVHEYCKVFAAGLYHALHSPSVSPGSNDATVKDQPLVMVRIKWKSKPKIINGKLVPHESGRSSRVVNAWMNRLLTSIDGDDSHIDFIKTANAGEHAMSTELALQLNFATGYAVEPFQLINLWEWSGVFPPTPPDTPPRFRNTVPQPPSPAALGRKVKIMQIETLNPHIHDFSKGEEHIARMQAQGLSTIFHSQLTPQKVKEKLQEYIKEELGAIIGTDGEPEEPRVYPPMKCMDFEVFGNLLSHSVTLTTTSEFRA